MPRMSRAVSVCLTRGISFHARPYQLRLSPRLNTSQHAFKRAGSLRQLSLHYPLRMPAGRLRSPELHDEPVAKRRRTEPSQPRFIVDYTGMASQTKSQNPTTLELTEEETKLRNLLLGVAEYIDNASPTEEADATVAVPKGVAQERIVLRWTGGWVRDKLLGVGSHDVDVAINKMTGENFGLKMLEYLKVPGNLEKHGFGDVESSKIMSGLHTIKANPEASKNLETATIKVMGIDLDLVNLRKETYDEVSRNPQMEFGTAEEDAMRRDATVNAMFYNLHTQQIEDFTERGFDDMAAKIIRTPLEPYQTFKDDPLRVLRLIRFASRLNYTVEPETAKAMANIDIQEALKIKIKRERVGIEMEKMLKGPDPGMALRLIDEANLYDTIFTDPTRELDFKPDYEHYRQAYRFVDSWFKTNENSIDPSIYETLLSNTGEESEDLYLAWVCTAVIPWADAPQIPHPKKNRDPLHAAYVVAQEGLKAPNRVGDVIAASMSNYEAINQLVGECQRRPQHQTEADQREKIGMALRKWGRSWRHQIFFSLLHEIVYGSQSSEAVLLQYANFTKLLTKLELLDVINLKPLINGTELAKALGVKPGPWMKDALDVVLAWQLRNPSVTDPAAAVDEVKNTSKSELPSMLISHFLTLTIRPLFSQTKTSDAENAPARWKTRENKSFLDLLHWVIRAADEKDLREHFKLIRPPVFRMLDDSDHEWNAKACELIAAVARKAPQPLKEECKNLFAEDLFAFFNHLPSLTPANESAALFAHVFPALLSFIPLAESRIAAPTVKHPTLLPLHGPVQPPKDAAFLDKITRQGPITVLQHAPTPSTYPELASTVLEYLERLIIAQEIEWVKHIQEIFPLLHAIMRDQFGPAHPEMVEWAARCLGVGMQMGWPRMDLSRLQQIYISIVSAWTNCADYSTDLSALRYELKRAVACIDAVFREESKKGEELSWWLGEVKRAREAKSPWVQALGDVSVDVE